MRPEVFDIENLKASILGCADHFVKVNQLAARKDVTAHKETGSIVLGALSTCYGVMQKEPVRSQQVYYPSKVLWGVASAYMFEHAH
jgi:hypothetical protein